MVKIERNVSCGGSLQGYLDANFEDIVEVFGEPTDYDIDGKIQVEWEVSVDGYPLRIYDWKTYGQDYRFIREWNIGGESASCVFAVGSAMYRKGQTRVR